MINTQLFFAPHPALAAVVNNIMIGRLVTDAPGDKVSFSFPPLPEHCILFYPRNKPLVEDVSTKKVYSLYACTITGQLTERTILSLGNDHLMIKIGFQPGALHRLLRLPMHEMLPYKNYDGEAVFGPFVKQVIDAFSNAADFAVMKTIADEFMLSLLPRVKKAFVIDQIIPDTIKYGGMVSIDELAKRACLSDRQFERAFKERMGVSPKFYSRLVRFGNAWLLKEANPSMTWTQVACACNYFDQMHLVRDFNQFANANPSEISAEFERETFKAVKGIFY